jgi:hypothetical protein
MNSFYSTLYGRFANLQLEQTFSARMRYPSTNLLPSLKIGNKIVDCIVSIPRIRFAKDSVAYGMFLFPESEFGEVGALKLCLASDYLLSAKSVLSWIYRDYTRKWLATKQDPLRAQYVINIILDALARKRIKDVEGSQLYNNLMTTADLLSAALLNPVSKDFSVLTQAALASFLLKVPMNVPRQIMNTVEAFTSALDTISIRPTPILETLKSRILPDGNNDSLQISKQELQWDEFAKTADVLYSIIEKISGKWHDVYLPYSHSLSIDARSTKPISIFQSKVISHNHYKKIRTLAGIQESKDSDEEWLQIYFEMMKEQNRIEKTEHDLQEATKSLNFNSARLPGGDFVGFYNLYAELLPNIRRMIDRVRQVKNALNDNPNQESGTLDLQLVIQSMSQQLQRNDVFERDENLSKDESWTILIDSSLSLSGSSRQIKSIAVCLAESANQTLGYGNPWAMFSFSDDFYCIKNYDEPYDNLIKSRIGALKQKGLSYIPDALRAASNLARKYSKDKNFVILVSDGVPSGYDGIEVEFVKAINEVSKKGVSVAAIGVGSSTIRKRIPSAKIVDEPIDLVNGFMDLYTDLAS